MTPEGKVKAAVNKVLRRYGLDTYWFMPVQTGMGRATLDYLGCFAGAFFAIETKAPGKKLTPRQWMVVADIEEAGGKVFIIDGDTSKLEDWLCQRSTSLRSME